MSGYHYVAQAELRRASEVLHDLYELTRQERNLESRLLANHLIGYVAVVMGESARLSSFWAQQLKAVRSYLHCCEAMRWP